MAVFQLEIIQIMIKLKLIIGKKKVHDFLLMLTPLFYKGCNLLDRTVMKILKE